MSDPFDMDPGAAANPAALQELTALGGEMVTLEAKMAEIEGGLKLLKERHTELRTKVLPEKMTALQMSSFKLLTGEELEVSDFVSGSLPKEDKDPLAHKQAVDYLVSIGGGDLIKANLTVEFERSQHNEALSLLAELKKKGYIAEVAQGVHSQTLAAFARERLREGEELTPERLGLFVGKTTKLKKPKKK